MIPFPSLVWRPLGFFVIGLCLGMGTLCPAASIEQVTHTFDGGEATGYRIDNRFFSITIVPQRGGRITQWLDKTDNADLVWIGSSPTSYGGLLDDHEQFAGLPYTANILEKGPQRVSIQLQTATDSGVQYTKTVTVYEDRPIIQVHYALANGSQQPARTLFRNVIRPGGAGNTGKDDLYCFPTRQGVIHTPDGFGRPGYTDQIGAPWMAYVNQPHQRAISAAFEGDTLQRFYAWRGSTEAPTYEFMFQPLEAGHRSELTYYWQLTHGLSAVDHASRDVVMQIQHQLDGQGRLIAAALISPTWQAFKKVTLTHTWLTPDRAPLGEPVSQVMDDVAIGSVGKASLTGPAVTRDLPYAILVVTLVADGKEIARMEKPLAFKAGSALTGYERKPQWTSHTAIEPLENWAAETTYQLTPDAQDQTNGYILYEPFGAQAGKRTTQIQLHMGVDEPETLPIYLYPLRDIGHVMVKIQMPKEIPATAVTLMQGEPASYSNWGQTHIGWKLPLADRLTPPVKEESSVWLRVNTQGWKPGRYVLPVIFQPEHAPAQQVEVIVQVHAVTFPARPTFTFDAHMLINFLCATGKGAAYAQDWDFTKGMPYLDDLQAHGNKVMVSYGQNALTGQGWQAILKRALVRESGQNLAAAIKEYPQQFRSEALPDLDLSFWDPLFNASIEHGFTVYRTYLGGTGGVRSAFLPISRQVWGDPQMLETDSRHELIHRWLYTQITQYIRDRGFRLVGATIDDEIPQEKYAQWVIDAAWARSLGFAPGVTQSNALLLNDQWMKQMGPAMDTPIIGAINKTNLDRRLAQGLLKPLRLETYESSANYWKHYDEERILCGWMPGYLNLDGCWIQCYYRWNQAEAIIFPTPQGPVSTAAWEGARDGLDDANYYQMALGLVTRMEAADATRGQVARQKLMQIVGPADDALLRVTIQSSRLGDLTHIAKVDVSVMRQAKERLLALIVQWRDELPALEPSLRYGDIELTHQGQRMFSLACPSEFIAIRRSVAQAVQALSPQLKLDELQEAAQPADTAMKNRVVLTTFDQAATISESAMHQALQGLSSRYPGRGDYVIRTITGSNGVSLIALVGGDEAGLKKAADHWTQFIDASVSDGRLTPPLQPAAAKR